MSCESRNRERKASSVRIVVAHNRYREAQPSGENTIVDSEIAQLTAAGVEVLPFIRSSDEIPSMSKAAKALLPISPIWAPRAQHDLSRLLTEHRPDVLHLHNPYPLISPWVVRTAHRHGVPVVQTVHNYRQVCSSGIYFRDGVICQDCKGRALGVPAIVHRCYRDSAAQSALMATTLAVHRGTWRSVDRYIALTSAIADHLRDYGIPDERIVVKPNSRPRPGSRRRRSATVSSTWPGSPRRRALDLLLDAWRRHPDGRAGHAADRRRRRAAPAGGGRRRRARRRDLPRSAGPGRGTRRRRGERGGDRRLHVARRAAHRDHRGVGQRPTGARHGVRRHPVPGRSRRPARARRHRPGRVASAVAGGGGGSPHAGRRSVWARPAGWSPRSRPRSPPPCRSPAPVPRAGPGRPRPLRAHLPPRRGHQAAHRHLRGPGPNPQPTSEPRRTPDALALPPCRA